MTIYKLNQQAYAKFPELKDDELKEVKMDLYDYLASKPNVNYFMMLNHEKRYYTVYTYGKDGLAPLRMADTMVEVAQTLGVLKAIEVRADMVEFWISDKAGECHMYAAFPYDQGVIEI